MESKQTVINSLPWIEKYRPQNLNDIILEDYTIKRLRKMIFSKNVSNLILDGPPGVGKTSTIKCIAKELYKKYYRYMVLELNTSDDRGIKSQESINNFKRSYVHIDEADVPNIVAQKLVILDEADNMTDKAKYIVLTFIENDSDKLRFILTCNNKNNIFPAIQSRCHIIHYPKISHSGVVAKLEKILRSENIIHDKLNNDQLCKVKDGMNSIAQLTDGDMRTAINMAQLTYVRFDEISSDNVYEIYDKPRPEFSRDILNACVGGDIALALQHLLEMRKIGYSGMDIAQGLLIALKLPLCNAIPENTKIHFVKIINHTMYNISKGVNSVLQMSACIAEMCK